MASRCLESFPTGLYAHWLDGEWLKIAHPITVEGSSGTLADIAEGGLKLHALFGTRIGISDIQLTDSEATLKAFADPEFRDYLKIDPNFITLISSPPRGVTDTDLARATSGLYRACSQPHWRTSLPSVREEVIKRFGDAILSSEEVLPAECLLDSTKGPGSVIQNCPEHRETLEGILHGVHFFAHGRGRIASQPNRSRSYIEWLIQFLNTPGLPNEHYNAFESLCESIALWVPDESKRYARSSLNSALECKEPDRNKWPLEYHKLWQSAVHAWNSNVCENLGTGRSSILPLPYALVGDRSRVTDAAGPFEVSDDLIRNRFESSMLTFDPTILSWRVIAEIRKEHQELQQRLQVALLKGDTTRFESIRSSLTQKLNAHIAPEVKAELRDLVWATLGLVGLSVLYSGTAYLGTAFTVIGGVAGADYIQRRARTKKRKRAVFNTLTKFCQDLMPATTED